MVVTKHDSASKKRKFHLSFWFAVSFFIQVLETAGKFPSRNQLEEVLIEDPSLYFKRKNFAVDVYNMGSFYA